MGEFAPSRFHGAPGRNVVVCNDNKIKIINDGGQEIAEYDLKEDKILASTAFGDFVVVSFSGDVSAKGSELGVLDIGAINAEKDTISERFDHDGNNNDSIFKWDRRLEGFIEAIGSMEDSFIFSLKGLGIYSMGISRNGKEIEINEEITKDFSISKHKKQIEQLETLQKNLNLEEEDKKKTYRHDPYSTTDSCNFHRKVYSLLTQSWTQRWCVRYKSHRSRSQPCPRQWSQCYHQIWQQDPS